MESTVFILNNGMTVKTTSKVETIDGVVFIPQGVITYPPCNIQHSVGIQINSDAIIGRYTEDHSNMELEAMQHVPE